MQHTPGKLPIEARLAMTTSDYRHPSGWHGNAGSSLCNDIRHSLYISNVQCTSQRE